MLPEEAFERIAPHLELFNMPLGEVLCESGGQLQHVYFPTAAIISLHYVMEDGASSEIAGVGNEGVLGVSLFLGGNTTPSRATVQTAGHTDGVGSNTHNQKLSERRANAVRMALTNSGVSADRVTTHGYGEEFPVASNDTSESRQMNRRVEVILSDEEGNIAQR